MAALGRNLAQFSPAAPRLRLRRVTLAPSATHLACSRRLGASRSGCRRTIAKKKEQEKPKGFTVWVGGFPDNCVDDHKLFHKEMEKGAPSLNAP